MPHPARPSVHVKASEGKKSGGSRGIPDFAPKPKPQLKTKGKPQATSAKSGRRGK
jgi:hypothetical protein